MKIFQDRIEAGKELAQAILEKIPNLKNGLILALPRGGVIVGNIIAQRLNLPLDIIVTRKIGHPENPEYAVAAVGQKTILLNPFEKINSGYLESEIKKERQEIKRRLNKYRGSKLLPKIKGKTIFIVDDGIATGLTIQAAIKELRFQNPQKIILAISVAPKGTIRKFSKFVDEIICLLEPESFFAIGQFYQNFDEIQDNEVTQILKRY